MKYQTTRGKNEHFYHIYLVAKTYYLHSGFERQTLCFLKDGEQHFVFIFANVAFLLAVENDDCHNYGSAPEIPNYCVLLSNNKPTKKRTQHFQLELVTYSREINNPALVIMNETYRVTKRVQFSHITFHFSYKYVISRI